MWSVLVDTHASGWVDPTGHPRKWWHLGAAPSDSKRLWQLLLNHGGLIMLTSEPRNDDVHLRESFEVQRIATPLLSQFAAPFAPRSVALVTGIIPVIHLASNAAVPGGLATAAHERGGPAAHTA